MYFVDASDPKYGNWMNFIQCARSRLEQNLKALQHNDCLFFEATRDIAAGEELLVWYDEFQYSLYMGIPTGYNRIAERSHIISKYIQCLKHQFHRLFVSLSQEYNITEGD